MVGIDADVVAGEVSIVISAFYPGEADGSLR